MAAAASDHHHHHLAAKSSTPASPSVAVPGGSTRTRLHSFSFPTTFGWGTHRLLRCSKDEGSAGASPPKQPHTPSPEKEKGQEATGVGTSQPPSRPWNLRSRRSATAAPSASKSDAAGKKTEAAGQGMHPPAAPFPVVARKRGFSVALTKEEIVADFIAIRGTAPPRRPKKRPRAVQREVDRLSLGVSLVDVNLDPYMIVEER